MVDAGTKISDDTITLHKDVKEKRRYAAIYHIDGGKGVVPMKSYPEQGDKKMPDDIASYESYEKKVFKEIYDEVIKYDKPLFISLDFRQLSSGGRQLSKLLLVLWCPDKAKVKDKMVAASTFGSLGGKLDGTKKIQVNDAAAFAYESLAAASFQGEKN